MSNTRYQAYFAVEGGWFKELPAHWQKLPSNRVFEQRREAAKEDDEQLSATQKYGVVPQSLFMALDDRKVTLALAGTDNFKHVDEGNFVISLRSFEGGIELSKYSGCVSPAYTCLKARKPIANDYYKFALKCSDYILALQSVTQGIRDGKNISYGEFSKLNVPYPPPEEQLAIATFLDRETAKIDDLIAEQKRLIELLQEKRQAEVSNAVTKGLNPDAPMKDSGVEWLGEVPEHWEVKPLKYLITLTSGGTPSKENLAYWSGSVPWASSKDLKTEELFDTQDHISQQALYHGAAALIPTGSILTVVRGMILLHTFPVVVTHVPMAINQDLKAITPLNEIATGYLAWLLRGASREVLGRVDEAGHGTKVLRIDSWLAMHVPVPPAIEQELIVPALVKSLREVDALIDQSQRAISLLQERRSALISAAVTGQIDVRSLVPEEVAA